ncbi:hypothetical protein DW793_10480 [Ruminococcus sp. AM31-15AC]|nr:hypothetical protein DW793_10480 [Ruminococcus sp. AM31-15AC]
MAAPYRANYQHKVKAPTSEDSKRYRAKPCRSLRQSLYRCKPAKRCRKATEELQKINYKAVSERNALHRFCCKKMFELFVVDHFFYSNNFP